MFQLARRLIVPSVILTIVGGLWSLANLKAEIESPLPEGARVDPALIQRALRACYASQYEMEFDPRLHDPVVPASGYWTRWNIPERS